MKEHTRTLILQQIFLSRNNILIDICEMLLLQLCFDIYSILNEEKRIFLRGLICPYTLFVQPVVFDGSVH